MIDTEARPLIDLDDIDAAMADDDQARIGALRQNIQHRTRWDATREVLGRSKERAKAFGISSKDFARNGLITLRTDTAEYIRYARTHKLEAAKDASAGITTGILVGGGAKEVTRGALTLFGLSTGTLPGIMVIGAAGGAAVGVIRETGRQYSEKSKAWTPENKGESILRGVLKGKFREMGPTDGKRIGYAALKGAAYGAAGAAIGFAVVDVAHAAGETIFGGARDATPPSPISGRADGAIGAPPPADPAVHANGSLREPAAPPGGAGEAIGPSTGAIASGDIPAAAAAARLIGPDAPPPAVGAAAARLGIDVPPPPGTAGAPLTPVPGAEAPPPPAGPVALPVVPDAVDGTNAPQPPTADIMAQPYVDHPIHVPDTAPEWVQEINTKPMDSGFAQDIRKEVGRLYADPALQSDELLRKSLVGTGVNFDRVDPLVQETMRAHMRGVLEVRGNDIYHDLIEVAIKENWTMEDLREHTVPELNQWLWSTGDSGQITPGAEAELLEAARKAYEVHEQIGVGSAFRERMLQTLGAADMNYNLADLPHHTLQDLYPDIPAADINRAIDYFMVSYTLNYDAIGNLWGVVHPNEYLPIYMGEIYYLINMAQHGDKVSLDKIAAILGLSSDQAQIKFARINPPIPESVKLEIMRKLGELYTTPPAPR